MDPSQLLPGGDSGLTRETEIRRDGAGRWWNGVDRIDHPKVVHAFESWVDVADDGRFCLKNDINWAYVAIEGPPVFVRALELDGDTVSLRLSGGGQEPLDAHSLREGPDGALYCDVRGGRLAARFTREAAQGLANLLEEDDEGVFLRIGGEQIRPPTVDDPLERV